MKKSCFGLLAAVSFAAIANPDSFNKKKPKLGANGLRIVLEQAAKMRHPYFSKMMLISEEFNGAAESLTGQKAPFSFFELLSSLEFFYFDTKDKLNESMNKFAKLKKMILSSLKGKKHLSFQNIRDSNHINDIAEILNHKPIQDTLESLALIPFISSPALQSALQNLKTLKSLSLQPPRNMIPLKLEVLNHPSIQDTLQNLCLKGFSLDTSLKNTFRNLKQLRSLSFAGINFNNQNIELPLSLETLVLGAYNIPETFWHSLSFYKIKKFDCEYSPIFFENIVAKWDHLESLTTRLWSDLLNSISLSLPKNIKILTFYSQNAIIDGSFLQNLNKLENLEIKIRDYNESLFTFLSPDFQPHLKHLKISMRRNMALTSILQSGGRLDQLQMPNLFWECLEKFNQLETLSIIRLEDFEELMKNLEVIKNAKIRFSESLKSLMLSGLKFENVDIRFPKFLKFLDPSGSCFKNTDIDFPESLSSFVLSKHTNFENTKIYFPKSPTSMAFSRAHFKNTNIHFSESLTSLDLSHACFENTKIEWPKSLKSLRALNYIFENTNIGFLKSLQSLKLNCCQLHNQDLSFSLELSYLEIENCQFLNTAIRFPESLKYLSFHRDFKDKNDYPNLDTLQGCNQLETLILSLGVDCDAKIILPQSLQLLDLRGSPKVDIGHRKDMQTTLALPFLKKIYLERLSKNQAPILLYTSQLKELEINDISSYSDQETFSLPSSLKFLKIGTLHYDAKRLNLDKLSQLESLKIEKMYFTDSSITPILPVSLRSLEIQIIEAHQIKLNLENLVFLETLHLKLAKPDHPQVSIAELCLPPLLKELRLRLLGSSERFWKNLILPSSLEYLNIYTDNENFLRLIKLPDSLNEIVINPACGIPGQLFYQPASLESYRRQRLSSTEI